MMKYPPIPIPRYSREGISMLKIEYNESDNLDMPDVAESTISEEKRRSVEINEITVLNPQPIPKAARSLCFFAT